MFSPKASSVPSARSRPSCRNNLVARFFHRSHRRHFADVRGSSRAPVGRGLCPRIPPNVHGRGLGRGAHGAGPRRAVKIGRLGFQQQRNTRPRPPRRTTGREGSDIRQSAREPRGGASSGARLLWLQPRALYFRLHWFAQAREASFGHLDAYASCQRKTRRRRLGAGLQSYAHRGHPGPSAGLLQRQHIGGYFRIISCRNPCSPPFAGRDASFSDAAAIPCSH